MLLKYRLCRELQRGSVGTDGGGVVLRDLSSKGAKEGGAEAATPGH